MNHLEKQLAGLKTRLVEMGNIAVSMAADASRAVVERDGALLRKVLASEEKLDRLQLEIDREAIRLITIYSPTAMDLRFLLMASRINAEIERIGDQAVNNCEFLEPLLSGPPPQHSPELLRMGEIACRMAHDALQAFEGEDTASARLVLAMDDEVDALNRGICCELLAERITDPQDVRTSMTTVLLARSLERIADHATNICEEVIYILHGDDVRHYR